MEGNGSEAGKEGEQTSGGAERSWLQFGDEQDVLREAPGIYRVPKGWWCWWRSCGRDGGEFPARSLSLSSRCAPPPSLLQHSCPGHPVVPGPTPLRRHSPALMTPLLPPPKSRFPPGYMVRFLKTARVLSKIYFPVGGTSSSAAIKKAARWKGYFWRLNPVGGNPKRLINWSLQVCQHVRGAQTQPLFLLPVGHLEILRSPVVILQGHSCHQSPSRKSI